MTQGIFIKGLAKNPRMIARWTGFPMNKEEGKDLWNEGIVPEDNYNLSKKYNFNIWSIPNEELKEFGKNRTIQD